MNHTIKLRVNFKYITIDGFLAVLFCLWIINPLSYKTIHQAIILCLGLLWCMTAYYRDGRLFQQIIANKIFLVSCIYPLFLLLVSMRADVRFEKKFVIEPLIVLIFLYYYYQKSQTMINCLPKCCIAYYTVISVYTTILLFINPYVARFLASTAHEDLASPLTGGYESVYCIMFLAIALIGVQLKGMKGDKGLIWLILLYLLFIIKSQYVMAFLLLAGGVLLMFAAKKQRYMYMFMLLLIICAMLLFFGFIDVPLILYRIGELLPESFFKTRAYALSGFISNLMDGVVSSQSSLGTISRLDIYMTSINSFLNNIIFGVGNVDEIGLVGNHATFLDELARYGIFGGGLYITTRLYMLFGVKKMIPQNSRNMYSVLIFVFMLMGFFNTMKRSDFILLLVLIIPYFYERYGESKIEVR